MAEQAGALDLEAIERREFHKYRANLDPMTEQNVRALLAEVRRLRAALAEDNEAATSRIWVAETERDEAQAEVRRLRQRNADLEDGLIRASNHEDICQYGDPGGEEPCPGDPPYVIECIGCHLRRLTREVGEAALRGKG